MKVTTLMVFVCACSHGVPDPDFFTGQGTAVFLHGDIELRPDQVSNALEVYAQTVVGSRDMLMFIKLHFYDKPVPCGRLRRAFGCWYFVTTMGTVYVSDPQCLSSSALAHELTHAFQVQQTGYLDVGHYDPWYWGKNGVANTARRAMMNKLCKRKGPKDE